MTQRAQLQTQILEKLGAPIVSAIGDVMVRNNEGADNPRQEAERTAELLARSVQLSVAIANIMDLREADNSGDSIRLMLAILSGSLIAGRYRQTGKMPSDADIQRLATALEAALTFSDNFVASAESAVRVEQIDPGAVIADENQISVQYVNTLLPLVNAVAGFSFGRPERKLVQEVTGRLVDHSAVLTKELSPNLEGKAARQAELMILRSLVELYVQAHDAETSRLMAMDEQSRAQTAQSSGGTFSMDALWGAFDKRVEMVQALGETIAGAGGDGGGETMAPPMPLLLTRRLLIYRFSMSLISDEYCEAGRAD